MPIKILKIHSDYRNGIIALILLLIIIHPIFLSDFVDFFVNIFSETLLNNDDLGGLLQNIGVALLTILIPLAIAVLQPFLSFKGKKRSIEVLTLVDYVLDIKTLILGTFLCFSPPLFWQKSSAITFRLIELVIWLIGIIILTRILWKAYEWMKASDFKFHFLYLEKLKKKEDIELAWSLVWQNKDMDFKDEIKFLKIFCKKINDFLKEKND